MSRADSLRQLRRFAIVGGLNTAVTTGLLALLAGVWEPALAYTLVYLAGLAFTPVMSNRYVFAAARSWPRRAAFVGWYLAVYGIGLAAVRTFDAALGWSPVPLAVATVAITAPLTFLGGRLVFTRPSPLVRTVLQESDR